MSNVKAPANTVCPIYSCPYLWWLIHKERMNVIEIDVRVWEMKEWLLENIGPYYERGVWHNDYGWGDGTLEIGYYRFFNSVWFRNPEDLVAFKLRWGIHV